MRATLSWIHGEYMTATELLNFVKENEVKQFDLRFTDLPGLTQHVSYPISQLQRRFA